LKKKIEVKATNKYTDKEDKLIKWVIQNESIKNPSEEFVSDIINKIQKIPIQQPSVVNKKPLVSVKLWFFVGTALSVLFGIAILKLNPDTRLSAIQDSVSAFIKEYFPLISSKIFILSTVFFMVFFIIQTLIISSRIHRMDFSKS
jgi:hypothetical protein